jgi:hypothetical protein
MSRRYVYLKNGPCMWAVIDTVRHPAVVTCLVPENNPEASESREAAHLCEVLNREHEVAEQVAGAARKRES